MRKLLLVALVLLALSVTPNAWAGWTYEKGDFKLGIDDLTAFTGYDFISKDMVAGSYTSVVEYKMLNLDAGIISGDEENENIAPMLGLSLDGKKTVEYLGGTWKLPISINGGIFSAYDILDERQENWAVGPYIGGRWGF
ncbi:hypothetical protein DRJ16_05245 [Candidatus Woesearchaeota archaeon]|nr:MAG: hypothetical protein DRJ16_05245 [Candidatus Woesearchaeota archaeon]